ncbi:MAG: hypothetical protein DRJ69_05720 [Thermoprotei archaeon]|nr:MAG: hypothetical protein DRJ69_05720 [Thermoprotei archaeon]
MNFSEFMNSVLSLARTAGVREKTALQVVEHELKRMFAATHGIGVSVKSLSDEERDQLWERAKQAILSNEKDLFSRAPTTSSPEMGAPSEPAEMVPTESEVGMTEAELVPSSAAPKTALDRFSSIVKIAVKRLDPRSQFVVFPHQEGEMAHLTGSAARALLRSLGLVYKMRLVDVKIEREDREDEKGKYYIYVASGRLIFGDGEVYVEGTASTRNKFFWMAKGKTKELHEINERDVRKAALTELYKECAAWLLGGRAFPIEMLKRLGVKVNLIPKVSFSQGG